MLQFNQLKPLFFELWMALASGVDIRMGVVELKHRNLGFREIIHKHDLVICITSLLSSLNSPRIIFTIILQLHYQSQ